MHKHGARRTMTVMDCVGMQPMRIIVIPIVLPTRTGGLKHTKTHRLKCSLTPTHETKKHKNKQHSSHKKQFYKIWQSFPLFYQ